MLEKIKFYEETFVDKADVLYIAQSSLQKSKPKGSKFRFVFLRKDFSFFSKENRNNPKNTLEVYVTF